MHHLARPSVRLPLIAIVVVVLGGLLALGATGKRVHLWQTKIPPGASMVVEGFGRVEGRESGALVCRQLSWHGVQTAVFNYSANNVLGRDECPLFYSAAI